MRRAKNADTHAHKQASAVPKYFPCLLQFSTGYRIWHASQAWKRKTWEKRWFSHSWKYPDTSSTFSLFLDEFLEIDLRPIYCGLTYTWACVPLARRQEVTGKPRNTIIPKNDRPSLNFSRNIPRKKKIQVEAVQGNVPWPTLDIQISRYPDKRRNPLVQIHVTGSKHRYSCNQSALGVPQKFALSSSFTVI